jgi:protein TonB
MTWNIHKKLLLTGLNTAPALDAYLCEPASELQWDPAVRADQGLFLDNISYKKPVFLSFGLAILVHLFLFVLWSRVGLSEAVSSVKPTLITFTFSFENAEPLPMLNQNPPSAPLKSSQIAAAKLSRKPAFTASAPIKEEPKPESEPEGVGEQASPAPGPSSVSGNAPITQPDETEAKQGSGSDGETSSFANSSTNSTSAFGAVYQTAYHTGSEGATRTPLIKADPNYAINPPPEYPALAKRRGYEGLVFLEVLVDRKGKVTDLKIAQSSGFTILDQAALQAVKHWLFKPAKRGPEAIEDRVKVPIRFQLQ